MPDTSCFICGGKPHEDRAAQGGHNYWSCADALAEAREHDRQVIAAGGPVYSDGTRNAEAHYVNETRPY